MTRLILASTSPRRHNLISQLGHPFEIVAPDFEEDMTLPIPPEQLACELALGKARSVASTTNAVVVGADTFLQFEGELLGKPKSEDQARSSLKRMRNRDCLILTGLAVVDSSGDDRFEHSECVVVTARIRNFSNAEILDYLLADDYHDKAGGIGLSAVESLQGDEDAALGLPLSQLTAVLRARGLDLAAS